MSSYLRFYDYLDLESGFIDSSGVLGPNVTAVDFRIAYNSIPPDFHVYIFQRSGREIAILNSTKFNSVTQMQIESATFATLLQSDQFDITRVFLLKTDRGAIYKLSDPVEVAIGETFNYSLVQSTP